MKTVDILSWIVDNFSVCRSDILKIAIFGSLARGECKPHDCDLLIITSARVESYSWEMLKYKIKKTKIDFIDFFKFPLNVILLTENEWQENKNFFQELYELKFNRQR
jgi:predicted nucleotidyltransferase